MRRRGRRKRDRKNQRKNGTQSGTRSMRIPERKPFPHFVYTRKLLPLLCFGKDVPGLCVRYCDSLGDRFMQLLADLSGQKLPRFKEFFDALFSKQGATDKKKKRQVLTMMENLDEAGAMKVIEFLKVFLKEYGEKEQKSDQKEDVVEISFIRMHYLCKSFMRFKAMAHFLKGEVDEVFRGILLESMKRGDLVHVLMCSDFYSMCSGVYSSGIDEAHKRERAKEQKKNREKLKKKQELESKKDDDGSSDEESITEKEKREKELLEEIEHDLEEKDQLFQSTHKFVQKVYNLREKITSTELLENMVHFLEKDITNELHRCICGQFFLFISRVLSTSYEDKEKFESICKDLIKKETSTAIIKVLDNFERDRDILGLALSLLFQLTKTEKSKLRIVLKDCYFKVADVIISLGKFKKPDISILNSCCLIISKVCTVDSAIGEEIILEYDQLIPTICKSLEREIKKPVTSTFNLYSAFSALINISKPSTVMQIDEDYKILKKMIEDVTTNYKELNLIRKYPSLIAIKVFCGKIDNQEYLSSVLETIVEEKGLEEIFKILKEIMFRKKEKKRTPQQEREVFFMFPAASSSLNSILQIPPKLNTNSSEGVLRKLEKEIGKDVEKNGRICHFAMGLEKQRKKQFSYKTVLIVFFIVMLILVLFPQLFKLLKKKGVETK